MFIARSDSLNRNDLGIGRILVMWVQAKVYVQMTCRVFLVFAMHDIPVGALEIILVNIQWFWTPVISESRCTISFR
jgi:hypothetical protein